MINKFNDFLNESYYEDLTPHTYSDTGKYKNVVNIGWLDVEKPFLKGEVPYGFIEKLSNLKEIHNHRGFHTCPFCNESRGNKILSVEGEGVVYFCPDLIKHYIKKHNYLPPQEFIDAVMNLSR